MARPLRVEFPGGVYHVTARGNARAAIFLADADRWLFLELLAHTIDRFGWRCHAYCLMPNHYHLLIVRFLIQNEHPFSCKMNTCSHGYERSFS